MRMLRPVVLLAAAALVAGCGNTVALRSTVTTPAPTRSAAITGPWWAVPAPAVDAGTQQNQVAQVAAVSGTDAWAVGSSTYPRKGAETQTTGFADHWDGRSWSRVRPPATKGASVFTGVAATSSRDVWIAGDDDRVGVLDHWDGSHWARSYTLQGGADDGATLSSVVATSPKDAWAVGTLPHSTVQRSGIAVTITLAGATTVLLHWDGTRWSRTVAGALTSDPHLAISALAAVGPHDIWAAGLRYRHDVNDGNDVTPLLAHWDGATWSIVATPAAPDGSAEFRSVTAVATNNVWAVGNSAVGNGVTQHPLAEHWNGNAWSIVPDPGAQGSFVSAAGDGQGGVYTVLGGFSGSSTSSLVHWNGLGWGPVALSTPALTDAELTDVSAVPGGTGLWAAGSASPLGGSESTPGVPLYETTLTASR
jgi:hypothetical protein